MNSINNELSCGATNGLIYCNNSPQRKEKGQKRTCEERMIPNFFPNLMKNYNESQAQEL